MKNRIEISSELYILLQERPVDWVRQQVIRLLEGPAPEAPVFVTQLLIQFAKRDLDGDPGEPGLRDWHELVLDAEAGVRAAAPEQADMLSRFAALLAKTIRLAARNPTDQLISRPSSRRVLLALDQLGGVDCSYREVRMAAGLGETHFSNIIRILRTAGVVISVADSGNGRERRLSLTTKGRAVVFGDPRDRTTRDDLPKLVRRRDNQVQYQRTLARTSDQARAMAA